MYKKARCTCKVGVLGCQPIAYLTFSSPPHLKLPVIYNTLGPFLRGKIRRVCTIYLAKPRLILDEMCRLYGKCVCYLRRVLSKTTLIFPRINGPIVIRQKQNILGANSIAPADSIPNVFSTHR